MLILSLKVSNESWVPKLLATGGVGGVLVIALAQFASAVGNRFSDKFWPPKGGLPTVRWLRATDPGHSTAQKQQWYAAIKQLTGLDIAETLAANPKEEDAIIEDATRQIRYKLRGKTVAKMAKYATGFRTRQIHRSRQGQIGFAEGTPTGSAAFNGPAVRAIAALRAPRRNRNRGGNN